VRDELGAQQSTGQRLGARDAPTESAEAVEHALGIGAPVAGDRALEIVRQIGVSTGAHARRPLPRLAPRTSVIT
jgi:hypothetical protein